MPTKTPTETPAKPVAPVKPASRKVAAKKAASRPTTRTAPKPKAPAAVKAAPEVNAASPKKPPKQKLVRDSFTMPQDDFKLIEQLKERALGFKRPTKKSELLRAGLQVLAGLSDAKLKAALEALAPLKPGRPRKASA